MKNYFLFIFLLITNFATAQISISGKVVDAATKQVLPNFNVYINNTSIGTVTNNEGKFKLTNPNNGKIELIISHLGYEKRVLIVEVGRSNNLIIEMLASQSTLNEVVIKGKKTSKSNIRNWTELFSTILIGSYKGVSLQCKIKNPDVLYFDYNKQDQELHVFAKEPLLIENAALGYLIRLELDHFVYAFKSDDAIYKYSVFFENLPFPLLKMQQVMQKRKLLYLGSNMHFMRALYSNMLDSSGFSIYRYNAVQNLERARVYTKILEQIQQSYANRANPVIDINRLFLNKDTVKYFNKVLEQDPVVSFDTVKLAPKMVSKPNKDSTLVNFNSKDTLMVSYLGSNVKGTDVAYKTQFEVKSLVYKHRKYKDDKVYYLKWYSYMCFFNKEGINIQPNGYYPEQGLFVYGDMGNRKLAGLLPFDYDPVKELSNSIG